MHIFAIECWPIRGSGASMIASVHENEAEARAEKARQTEARGHLWRLVVAEARRS